MKYTILLIEDDPLLARAIALQVGPGGYDVIKASDGVQGLRMIRTCHPDLVLLDLMLPGTDGFTILERVREDPEMMDVPVIVVSAKSQESDRQTAARLGANAYLTKPYRKADLLDTMASLLNGREAESAPMGIGVTLTGQPGLEAASVGAYVGLALADRGETTTLVDLRPFSVQHSLLLRVAPRSNPVPLMGYSGSTDRVLEAAVEHPTGLRLINNLEGRGEAGELTAEDARLVLRALLAANDFVLAELPLSAAELVREVTALSAQTFLVTQGDPASLAVAQSRLTMMEQAGVDQGSVGLVLIGSVAGRHLREVGADVAGAVPPGAGPDNPAFQELADWLCKEASRSTQERVDNAG